tara:strand:+ start:148 stop:507 length:360 start_codon:yes stop_codon:yes gene_type:complete
MKHCWKVHWWHSILIRFRGKLRDLKTILTLRFGAYRARFGIDIEERHAKRLRSSLTVVAALGNDILEHKAGDLVAGYLFRVKRNVDFVDRTRATFHWIKFIQFRYRRGVKIAKIKLETL